MPVLRTAVMAAFGVIALGMLVAALFVLLGAREPFVGVLLAVMGVVALTILVLMRRYQ